MGKSTIYVTGHKNPDTDSIISAMAYAYFKQQLGFDALAVRIGAINQETEYVLNLFNEFAPPLASDIKTSVRDIDFDGVVTCSINTNLREALDIMQKNHKKVICVVDNHRHLIGMATISDVTRPLYDTENKIADLLKKVKIEDIAEFLNGELIYAGQRENNGQIAIIASTNDSEVSGRIAICADNNAAQISAIKNGAALLIISRQELVNEGIVDLARRHDCSIIVCDESIYNISKEIYMCMPVGMVMSQNITTFRYDQHIDDVKQVINKSRFRSYPVVDAHFHVIGTLSRYHVFKHTARNLILVDHNELSQSIDGADEANIIEIIDHHRIGGIKTAQAISFRNERTGCCASIISKIFQENNVPIPADLAGLLCCAIISDTVNFKSVTCTQNDIDQAKYLSEIGNFNLEEMGPKILAAGASLSDKSCETIFHKDLKRFKIGKVNVAIAQTNVVGFDSILPIRDEMNKVINDFTFDSNCQIVMMVFSLIDGSGSYVLTAGGEIKKISDLLNKDGVYKDGFVYLPNVISRKQQLVPLITEAIELSS